MANELRVRSNFAGGLVEDNPLSSSATTLTSAGLVSLPAVGSTQHMAIILDPDGVGGNPEIAYVTAHTALATTATIVKGQEGTTARDHARDTPWLHGPTIKDFDGDAAWTAPTFTNSWVNFGGSYATVGYRKDGAGWVHLRGSAKGGTLGASVFTLPVGYRPAASIVCVAPVYNGSSYVWGAVEIATAGTVAAIVGFNNLLSLDNITFLAET